MVRLNHSITSAYTLGVYISTVAGRLMMIGRSGRRLDDVHHRLADLHRELGLGAGEALRGVLVADVGPGQHLLELLAQLGCRDCDVDDAGLVEPEDDASLKLGRRVVEVHDRAGYAHQRFVRPLDELLATLHQHLDRDVVGDQAVLDDRPLKVEVGLGSRREPDLDLLEPDLHQRLEEAELALGIHRVDECLVPVAQVHAGPVGRLAHLAIRPGPVAELQRDVRPVQVKRHGRDIAGQSQAGRFHPFRAGIAGVRSTHHSLPLSRASTSNTQP